MTLPARTDEEWYTLDTLTFLDFDGIDWTYHHINASLKVIEGMTSTGQTVEVVYCADGDYEDRWIDVTGRLHDIIYWRPCRDL